MKQPIHREHWQQANWDAAFNKLCKLANVSPGQYDASPEGFDLLLSKLEEKMPGTAAAASSIMKEYQAGLDQERVLVVGLLGIINFQLKTVLQRNGYAVTIVKSAEEAVQAFQKNDYKKVIIDLFMPSEVDGFRVINEIKKISMLCNIQFDIVILANPTSNQAYLESQSSIHGADYFLVRNTGWQDNLLDFIQGNPAVQED